MMIFASRKVVAVQHEWQFTLLTRMGVTARPEGFNQCS